MRCYEERRGLFGFSGGALAFKVCSLLGSILQSNIAKSPLRR